jgi:phosphoglycerol transferase MdoB-like AlkP superfamily enzyme
MLFMLFLFRCFFFVFNHSYFRDTGFFAFLRLAIIALRFDLSSLIVFNALFIAFSLFPSTALGKAGYQLFLRILFLTTNSIVILANACDLVYFRYTLKRMSFDVFTMIGRKSDFLALLPEFMKHYWYVLLTAGLAFYLLFKLYRRLDKKYLPIISSFRGTSHWLLHLSCFLFLMAAGILAFRGGWQLIPLSIAHAGSYTQPGNIPLIIDSSFSLFKTSDQDQINVPAYFRDNELKTIYSPIQQASPGPLKKMNVVIVILESFSKEYTGIGNRKSYTPFLDSLMGESYVFTHAFANGKRSAEGIPAILAGVPTLMEEPFNSSGAAGNRMSSLPLLLKPLGYTSAFFHGGTNGTMSFDSFCNMAGFDYYFGRSEYNNEADFDGHWGISDEPFLRYFARKTGELKEPFLASVFTLSSHDPYEVPAKYKGKFPAGDLEIIPSVGYTDFCLKQFFAQIKTAPWFSNTLFVFTPDHTGISADPLYANNVGQYEIPIFFYSPAKGLKGRDTTTMQQMDILPTVLSWIGYDKPFFSFGKNALDKSQTHFAVNFTNGFYQLYMGDQFMQFNGNNVLGFYDIKKDSLLQNNMATLHSPAENKMERFLKAFLQTYEEALVNNHMTLTPKK